MKDKGYKLNERVWELFEKAGFSTYPNSNNTAEKTIEIGKGKNRTIDLYAEDKDLQIKIIGWNKAKKRLQESITTHINDYAELNKKIKADAILFVSTEKEFTDEDKEYAKKYKGIIWGEKELKYYESLVETIKTYAKYEIIHSFGVITTEEQDTHTVLALKLKQPRSDSNNELFLFTITPDKLLKTCTVYRRAQGDASAYQRMLNRKRLPKIGLFLKQGDAILPVDIVLFLSEDVNYAELNIDLNQVKDKSGKHIHVSKKDAASLVALSIPMKYASMEVIDGQHRLYGFIHTEPATRSTFNLIVAGISKIPKEKRRDTFIAINDNARRMDPNLVSFLRYSDSTEEECQKDNRLMAIRIVVELNKISPFENKIRLLDVGNQKITLKGFSGYDLKGLISKNGLLRKYHSNTSEEYVRILKMYFNIIKHNFPKQYNHPDEYIIFQNKGISAFLKLLKSILKTCKCPLTEEVISKYMVALKKHKEDKDWDIMQLKNAYVGSQGWKVFHRDLVKTIQKEYPDFKE